MAIEYRIGNYYYYKASFTKGVVLLQSEYIVDNVDNISARGTKEVFGENNFAKLGQKAMKKLTNTLDSRFGREHRNFIEITVIENCAGFQHYQAYLDGISNFIKMLTERYKGQGYFICMLVPYCFAGLVEPMGFETIKLKRDAGYMCDSISVMKVE